MSAARKLHLSGVPRLRRIPKSLRKKWLPRPPINPVDWLEQHFRLPPELTVDGVNYWSPYKYPYQVGIVAAWHDPKIRKISVKAATQIGKTLTGVAGLQSKLAASPAPAIVAGPTKDLIQSYSEVRLYPTLRLNPHFAAQMEPAHLAKWQRVNLADAVIYCGWSGAPDSLGDRTAKYIVCYEVDKWNRSKSAEAHPFALVQERCRAYRYGWKMYFDGTPTLEDESLIEEMYLEGDRRRYHVPCPHCGKFQILVLEQIKGGKDADGVLRSPAEARRFAHYECIECKQPIFEHHKPAMLRAGTWAREGERVEKDGSITGEPVNPGDHASFHLPRWYSPAASFGGVLEEFLTVKDNPILLRNFVNSSKAEVWRVRQNVQDWETLKTTHTVEIGIGFCPEDAVALIATTDVQDDRFYTTIFAWRSDGGASLVTCGISAIPPNLSHKNPAAWAEVDRLVYETQYLTIDTHRPVELRIHGVDCGFRPQDVYEYCRRHPKTIAVRGQDESKNPAGWWITRPTHTGKNQQTIKGGSATIFNIHVSAYKQSLLGKNGLFENPATNPGGFRCPIDTPNDYFRQVTNEALTDVVDKKGYKKKEWRMIKSTLGNHYLDDTVYNFALAAAHGLNNPAAGGTAGGGSSGYRPAGSGGTGNGYKIGR